MAGFARRTLLPKGAGVSGTRLIYPLTTVSCSIVNSGSSKTDTSADFAMWGEGVVFTHNNKKYYYYTVYYETTDEIMWDQDSKITLPRFAHYPTNGCAVGTIDRRDNKNRSGISHLDINAPMYIYGPSVFCDMHIDGVGVDSALACRINVIASAVDVGYDTPYTGWIKVS